jgi:hypothetical protein
MRFQKIADGGKFTSGHWITSGSATSMDVGPEIPQYDAFITYRRSDGVKAASRLRSWLRSFRLPKTLRSGRPSALKIFLDAVYERGAADFYAETIRPALLSSRWLIVVATPDAAQARDSKDWIVREIEDFSSGPNGQNIIAVRALGNMFDVLPADLLGRYPNLEIVDLRNDTGPVRFNPFINSRLRDEHLKIIAPLFGISIDEMPTLRREEEKRRAVWIGV